jgi:hypothetical protein
MMMHQRISACKHSIHLSPRSARAWSSSSSSSRCCPPEPGARQSLRCGWARGQESRGARGQGGHLEEEAQGGRVAPARREVEWSLMRLAVRLLVDVGAELEQDAHDA